MSSNGLHWAMGLKGLSVEEKLLLIYMGDVTPMDGWCGASLEYLAERMETSEGAVSALLTALVERGVVKRSGDLVYLAGGDVTAD